MCGFKSNLTFDRINQQTTDKDEINFRTTRIFFLSVLCLLKNTFTSSNFHKTNKSKKKTIWNIIGRHVMLYMQYYLFFFFLNKFVRETERENVPENSNKIN